MTTPIEPRAEIFRGLTEAVVLKALDDRDPNNPIATEVARLMAGYTANFRVHVQRLGHSMPDILHIKPRWPIEAVAMRLATEAKVVSIKGHRA